jgi:hypothetical protein
MIKNVLMFMVAFCCLSGFSFGGECTNGVCTRPSGRVLSTTKTVVKEVVKVPRRIVSGCVNGRCHSRSVTRVR